MQFFESVVFFFHLFHSFVQIVNRKVVSIPSGIAIGHVPLTITQEEGGIYVSKFTVNEPTHKEFEAGYEESEVDLRVIFDLIDGKW